MDMSRESKIMIDLKFCYLNITNNKVTELKVLELSFKHISTDKGPIVSENKGIFTHLKSGNCDNYYDTTCMITELISGQFK